MPELPEVQTTVDELRESVIGRKITDVWTDCPKLIKKPESFDEFKGQITGCEIQGVSRRAKYVILHLSNQKTLLVHQKMTGHLLVGKWRRGHDDNDDDDGNDDGVDNTGKRSETAGEWISAIPGPLKNDRLNDYIRVLFWLNNGEQLALSDLRKFAKIELYPQDIPKESTAISTSKTGIKGLDELGPEPLNDEFSFEQFQKQLEGRSAAIKTVLMDPKVVVGIGNIYSDEILWFAKVHPEAATNTLTKKQLHAIYKNIEPVLEKAVRLQGTSFGDYRKPDGTKGGYQEARKVYSKEGERCPRCGTEIERIKVNQRSAHFCPSCQSKD